MWLCRAVLGDIAACQVKILKPSTSRTPLGQWVSVRAGSPMSWTSQVRSYTNRNARLLQILVNQINCVFCFRHDPDQPIHWHQETCTPPSTIRPNLPILTITLFTCSFMWTQDAGLCNVCKFPRNMWYEILKLCSLSMLTHVPILFY